MKEAGNFILRIIVKAVFITAGLLLVIYVIDVVRDEVYFAKSMKEFNSKDSVSPVTRGLKDYNVTEDTAFIRRLEDSTKELMK